MKVVLWIIGIAVGSFLNVCICRIPAGESVVKGASHCSACGRRIAPYDLIPVLSYMALGGRCRYCRARIGLRHPAIELLTGLVFLLLCIASENMLTKALYITCMSALIAAAFIDADTLEVPNGISLFVLATGALSFTDINLTAWERIAGLLLFCGTLLAARMASRGGMGMGDIKLAAGCGLLLGARLTVTALFAAFILGMAAALPSLLRAAKKPAERRYIPFVPLLAAGVFMAMLFGDRWWLWYLSL